MKILFTYLFCGTGGVEAVLYARLREMRRRSNTAISFFLQEASGLDLLFRDIRDQVIIGNPSDLIRLLRSQKWDYIVSIDTPEIHPLALRFAPRAAFVYEVHTTYCEHLSYLHTQELMKNVRALIVPSQAQKKLVSSIVHSIGIPIFVVPNPITLSFLKKGGAQVTPSRPIILWVGRLDSHKNWIGFVQLAGQLRRARVQADFWLVGGARSSTSEKHSLWKTLKIEGLADCFKWLPVVDHHRMPGIYRYVAASNGCYVSTSINESFGMTVIEAMACGCPVVVPNVGGICELVAHGQTGLLYEAGDLVTAAGYIETLLTDGTLRNAIIESGRDVIAKKYTPETCVTQLLDALASATARNL